MMRISIDIEGGLIEEAIAATGLPTKKAAVEEGLKRLVRGHRRQQAIKDMSGLGGTAISTRYGRAVMAEPR